jgi:CBS domain-containing protein
MPPENDSHKADPEAVLDFLKSTRPFNELEDQTLERISKRMGLDFFDRNTLILEQHVSELTHLFLIFRGAVQITLTNSEQKTILQDVRGEGSHFGALSIIRDVKSLFNVEAIEDTFCYLLEKHIFLDLLKNSPSFAGQLWEKFSSNVMDSAYEELRSKRLEPKAEQGFSLFTSKVRDLLKRPLEVVSASDTIQLAASRMTEKGVGSILVRDDSNDVVGIITDNDLRTKVVSMGVSSQSPVSDVMAFPVKSIPADTLCFDALITMMNIETHHLAITEGNTIMGVVSAHDIMVDQGVSPISLYREIVAQTEIEGLYPLSEATPLMVRKLITEGAKANDVAKLITALNDHIVTRVLFLLEKQLGPPPYPYCWILMGSEGRQEQTFKTDQDNALIYETPPEDWDHVKSAKLYFRRFGNLAIEHLEACGYPLCKGEIMASNPKWRKPFIVWRNYFDRWMSAPEPQAVLHATIFFDFRAGHGHQQLAEKLRDYVVIQAPNRGIFLMNLARDCMSTKIPLSFFRNFLVEKDGEHKDRLDIKSRGLTPFVDFARIMALRNGLRETNTLSRFRILGEAGLIPSELYTEVVEAYEFQTQIRLVHQLRMLESGLQPDNYVDPAELSDLEKQTLKEAFAVIGRIQGYIKNEFRVLE